MNCQTVLTLWIIIQTIVRAAKMPSETIIHGKDMPYLVGGIIGIIIQGFGMIALLYFGGFYN